MEIRGELWTARRAESELGLAKGTVDVWVSRGHVEPALEEERPRLFWSDDLYDRQFEGRSQTVVRDTYGRFSDCQEPLLD